MTKIVHSSQGERHPYAVRMGGVLDGMVGRVKAAWLARVLDVPESVLSECRRGTRNLHAHLVPLVDEALGSHALLEELAAMEGCGIHSLEPSAITAADLESMFPAILRAEGAASADVFQALADGHLDSGERDRLHAHFTKLRHYFQSLEEATSPHAKGPAQTRPL